jgi:hypothetical protein
MSTKLRVLVLESERGAATTAIQQLSTAGHDVVRCHQANAPAFPCRAISGDEHCPLRDDVVDVALTVRERPRSQPAPHEDGVSCAIERHVPLVVAGGTALNPFGPWAAEVLGRTDDIVAACERAAAAPIPRHCARAMSALAEVLQVHGLEHVVPSVIVRRVHGNLLVTVHNAEELDHAAKAMASVRMIGALRELDATAGGIDVVFEP